MQVYFKHFSLFTSSALCALTLTGCPLAAPTLVSPPNGAVLPLDGVILDWDPVFGATQYELEHSVSADFSDSEAFVPERHVTAVRLTGLGYGTTISWRVRALNDTEASEWSEVRNCRTEDFVPEPEDEPEPIEDAGDTPETATFLDFESLASIVGFIDNEGDLDVYRFTAEPNEDFLFLTFSSVRGDLYTSDGQSLLLEGILPGAMWRPPASGEYLLYVENAGGADGVGDEYRIVVTRQPAS